VAVCATYFVQTGEVTRDVFLASTGVGLLAANILVVNNYRDVETDAKAGKRTLVVRFGRRAARMQFGVSLVVALTIPAHLYLGGGYEPVVLLPLAIAPMALRQIRRLEASETPAELIVLLGDTGKLLAIYAVLLSAGVVFG
jgi:1,4-dihydroxy-2-naphthoate octaprenyltransferase